MDPIYILKLPMPSSDLNPNRIMSVHWSIIAKTKKKHRLISFALSKDLFKDILNRNLFEPYNSCTIKRVFYFNDKRRRDKDNYDAMTKAYSDGLKDCGIIKDDSGINWLGTEFVIQKDIISYLEYHFYELKY